MRVLVGICLAGDRYVRYHVHMNKTLSATSVRKQFFQMLDFAEVPGSSVTITREGHPPMVLMTQDEVEGWKETLEIMSDPELVKAINEGIEDMKAGRVIPWETVKKKYEKKSAKR